MPTLKTALFEEFPRFLGCERFRHPADRENSEVSIRRLEILVASVWPGKFTQAAKEAVVAETLSEETALNDVARRHGLEPSLVYRWRREFGVVEEVETSISFVSAKVEAPFEEHAPPVTPR
jgi:transposase-like protein